MNDRQITNASGELSPEALIRLDGIGSRLRQLLALPADNDMPSDFETLLVRLGSGERHH